MWMPRWEFDGDKNVCGETGETFQKRVSCSVNRIVPVDYFSCFSNYTVFV